MKAPLIPVNETERMNALFQGAAGDDYAGG